MLHDQGFPLSLWEEACTTTIYLQNKIHHKILRMIKPEEDLPGRKPDVSHFHFFGSIVYFHVSKDIKKMLEPIAKRRIFVGYTKTPHIY